MRLLLPLFLLLVLACQQDGQQQSTLPHPGFEVEKQLFLGSAGLDVANYIISVSTGGYLVAGYVAADSGYHGYLVRTSEELDTLWTKKYGHPGDNRIWSVAESPDGDFMAVGFSNSAGSNGAMDVWIMRVDASGEMLWEKKLGGPEDELSWDIKRLEAGSYAIAAQTASEGAGNFDAWLLNIDGNGETIWDQTYGTEGRERVFSIAQGKSGNLFATGIYTPGPAEGPIDSYTIGVSSVNGNLIWEDRLDKGKDDTGHGLVADPVGGVWVTGYTTSVGVGSQDGFLAKYVDGQLVQFHTYGGPKMDRLMNVAISEKTISMVGYSNSFSDKQVFDIWLQLSSISGDSLTSFTFPGAEHDRGVHLAATGEGFILVGTHVHQGKTEDPDFTILGLESNKQQ